jgi:hypothetical protein
MDIARYIGLFLLKNNFCYIHGLGNLELKKRPAVQEGESLKGPRYEVMLTPTGSIDDNLANFIAVNEQISIAKASNALREFSIESRAKLLEGSEVLLPAIGKFVETDGRIGFITDPHLQYTPRAIPKVSIAHRPEAEKSGYAQLQKDHPANNRTTVNWGKILIWVLIMGIVVTGVIFGIRFISEQQQSLSVPVDTLEQTVPVFIPEEPALSEADSGLQAEDTVIAPVSEPAAAVSAEGRVQYKVIISEYDNLARAQKREKQLISYGNQVELATRDSLTYYVILPMNSLVSDTARIMDSLRKQFNPKGVGIYR